MTHGNRDCQIRVPTDATFESCRDAARWSPCDAIEEVAAQRIAAREAHDSRKKER